MLYATRNIKIIKFIGAGICLLLALSQIIPVYFIIAALIQGQDEVSTSYFIGKLIGHIFITAIVLIIASKLMKSVINKKEQ